MDVQLVVVRAFGRWEKGDVIADPVAMLAVLDGENRSDVVRVSLPAPTSRKEG